jgi:small-conductance mechanosensitive channel
LDNRLIIVPNSSIAQNEVINYSYPDPTYRYETQVSVAYGTDIETARRVMIDTVRQLEEVLVDQPDRPVDALYVEMGDSAMIFRVRWWMASYVDTRYVEDKAHSRIHTALNAAGIQIPFPQRDVHLDITPETANMFSANKPDSGNQHKRND